MQWLLPFTHRTRGCGYLMTIISYIFYSHSPSDVNWSPLSVITKCTIYYNDRYVDSSNEVPMITVFCKKFDNRQTHKPLQ